jgi:ATP-dependent helicase/nuclease subunit B
MLASEAQCRDSSADSIAVPDVYQALQEIASARTNDPLAPVTVVAPSHAAALQLRRRLAMLTPFAAVRFETLPRVAELIGAGSQAASGRAPLARPIADYIAGRVALESRPPLDSVRDVPGYARVLRQMFRRLKRAGIRSSADVRASARSRHLGEVLRLYDLFVAQTGAFYDEEDLFGAATNVVRSGAAGVLADLGDVYIVPPEPRTAAGHAFLDALRDAVNLQVLSDPSDQAQHRFVIAPDPASEAQEVARTVLDALESGVPVQEIAVFHGAAGEYARLLREAFEAAGVTSVPLPGVPVSETRAGRGVLGLARLPGQQYARTALIDFLSVSPVREWLPAAGGAVHEATTAWDRITRDASVTRGIDNWRSRLGALIREREASAQRLNPDEEEPRITALGRERDHARRLLAVVEGLAERLEPLANAQPAAEFIRAFKTVVEDYIDPGAEGLGEALDEIDQLGTVGAVGGEFTLAAFSESLAANLDARYIRPQRLGDGVVIADYRAAAGMRFERVVLCGSFEGAFPAGPGTDSILVDHVWRSLKEAHPFIEDAETRIAHAKEAARRAVDAAGHGSLTWTAPAFQAGGTKELYPSPLMAEAYSRVVGARTTAAALRSSVQNDFVRRIPSPLSASLRGPVLGIGELAIRSAVDARRRGEIPPRHPRHRSLLALRSRRSQHFTEWDGNLAALDEPAWLEVQRAVSPTSLEHYGTCGYRYFCRSLLKLDVLEEPEEKQTMDAITKGSVVHEIIERFFKEQQSRQRPGPGEAWTAADRRRLLEIADEVMAGARETGQTGLDIFLQHEARTIKADLARFLEEDTIFRRETGAVPVALEEAVPETEIAGVRLRGYADRIDRTPDGKRAWVIDYKTGSAKPYEKMERDPLKGGTKLQLPVYLSAVKDAEEATALYWFVTQGGGFLRVEYTPSPENDARYRATLEAILAGIRAGAFPAVPDEENEFYNSFKNCGFCEFDRICSRRRDLEFERKQDDAGVTPWLNVAVAATGGGE